MSEPLADELWNDNRIDEIAHAVMEKIRLSPYSYDKRHVSEPMRQMRDALAAQAAEHAAALTKLEALYKGALQANERNVEDALNIRQGSKAAMALVMATLSSFEEKDARIAELEATIHKDWQAFEAFDERILELEAQLAERTPQQAGRWMPVEDGMYPDHDNQCALLVEGSELSEWSTRSDNLLKDEYPLHVDEISLPEGWVVCRWQEGDEGDGE